MTETRHMLYDAIADAEGFKRKHWQQAILTWAASQVSRRAIMHCVKHDQQGINILLDATDNAPFRGGA